MKKSVRTREIGLPSSNPYFAQTSQLAFIKSGSTLLDCVLGGGYVLGRVTNIVGDKSSGKTMLAMEASTVFFQDYPKGSVYYVDAEAAFDPEYAKALGAPIGPGGIDVITTIETVEDWYEHIQKVIDKHTKSGKPGLYILDSLDALSDRAESGREIGTASYGGDKAKKMGEIFRRIVRDLNESQISLIIISQVRDNIGVMFGEKHKRSGGKALDFYASQVVWLSHLKILTKEIRKIKRAIGVRIRAKCKKNKIGLPFRDCEFDIKFGYGVDDIGSMREWLKLVQREDLIHESGHMPSEVMKVWQELDQEFLPKERKY